LFNQRLEANIVGNAKTTSAKLINQGSHDNVVLPGQQTEAMTRLCANSKGTAALKIYQGATHYNTMILSFTDTLNWMQALREGRPVATTCAH
jgi:alpha-beta hydrolase superfamily lysophospholipase